MSGTIGDPYITFTARFQPPFPEITHIPDEVSLSGQFSLGADESAGEVKGTYQVSRNGEEVEVTLHPDGGREPRPTTLFLKFFFCAIKLFRQWPKTYQWTAKIKLNEGSAPFMESKWERI